MWLILLGSSRLAFAIPPLFQDQLVISELNYPTSMIYLPDGNMLVTEKTGQIWLLDPSLASPVLQPYLNINDINVGGERGLLDIVLDPGFPNTPYVYASYHRNSDKRLYVSRFTHQSGTASIGTELVIWKDPQLFSHVFHHGGGLSFGPDGYLYLTTGEQFNGLDAQDLTNARGKIIRIGSDGSIPTDNPFVDGPGGNLDEIWAYGLRNPWRARWDLHVTGSIGPRLFIGEVGGNNNALSNEDVHIGRKGANYGWPFCEGTTCSNTNQTYDPPLFTYEHDGEGASLIGGIVYHGSQFPQSFANTYFYGDYVQQYLRYITFDSNGAVATDHAFQDAAGLIVDIKQGADGALYYLQVASDTSFLPTSGAIRKISYNDGNQAPQITLATADITSGEPGLAVQFSGAATDTENDLLEYVWVFGDGQQATGANVTHIYPESGSFQARLQVSDLGKTTLLDPPITITVGSKPVVTLLEPVDGSTFRAGETISFSASATDADSVLTENSYKWTINLAHNEHTHPEHEPVSGSSGTLEIPTTGHSFFSETGFDIIVEVTDTEGLSTTKSVHIYPEEVDITLNSQPSGIALFLDEEVITTPLVYDNVIGFKSIITAPQTACIDNIQYSFDNWSNAAAASFNYTLPDHNETLTATYTTAGDSCSNSNASPLAFADEATVVANTSQVIQVLNNDVDNDGTVDKGSVVIVTQPQHGLVNVNSNTGAITYTHEGSLATSDFFSYTVDDNDGAISNEALVSITVSASSGVCGYDMQLDGENDWINIPNFTLNNDFTIEAWVNLATDIGNKDSLFGQDGVGPDVNFNAGKVRLYAGSDRITANTAISPETWTHIAITRSESNLSLFINGQLDATDSWDGKLYFKALGRGNQGFLEGKIDEVRIWEISRTDDQISQNFNQSVATNSPGLIGYWTFDGSGQVVIDSSGLGNHGSLGSTSIVSADDPIRVAFDETCGSPRNIAPTAQDDPIAAIDSGATITIPVLDNDIDSDGTLDFGSVTIVSPPNHGIVTVLVTGEITYTHDASETSSDLFTYTVRDNQGSVSNVATVNLTITQIPVAHPSPDSATVIVDEFHSGNTPGSWVEQAPTPEPFAFIVTADDITMTGGTYNQHLTRLNTVIDPNRPYTMQTTFSINTLGGTQSFAMLFMQDYQLVTDPINAWSFNLDLAGGGIVKHMGFADGSFQAIGEHPATWAEANTDYIFRINVNQRMDGSVSPKWVTGKITTIYGAVLDHFEVDYSSHPWQPDLSGPVRIGFNSLEADWVAKDLIVWYTDGLPADSGVNYMPLASNDTVEIIAGNSIMIPVLNNDADSDGTLVNDSVSIVTAPIHGTVSVDLVTGEVNYTHNGSLSTSDSFTYTVKDNEDAVSNVATVNIIIMQENTSCGMSMDFDGNNDLINIPDMSFAEDFTIEGWIKLAPGIDNKDGFIGQEGHGADINFYDSRARLYIGSDVVVAHTQMLPDTWTHLAITRSGSDVSLYLNGILDAIGTWDGTLPVQLLGRGNRGFLEGNLDEVRFWDVARSGAQISDNYNQSVATDSLGLVGYWSFNQSGQVVTDWSGLANHGLLGISNAIANDDPVRIMSTASFNENCNVLQNIAPVAQDDSTVQVDSGSSSITIPVLNNDSDSDGSLVNESVTIVTAPTHGDVTIDLISGEVVYTHDGSEEASDTFTYTVNDNENAVSNIATVSIEVIVPYINIVPVAQDDSTIQVTSGDTITIPVLNNDSDSDGTLVNDSVTIITAPTHGDATIDLISGEVIYIHDGSAGTSDTFTYTVNDNENAVSNIATVSIEVIVPYINIVPVAQDDSTIQVTSGDTITIPVLNNDSDSDGTLVNDSVTIITAPTHGDATIDLISGEVIYIHDGSAGTSDTFTYTVNDNENAVSNIATVSIAVIVPYINITPVAQDDTASSIESGDIVTITVLNNDSDSDGTLDNDTVTIVTAPTHGTTHVDLITGKITYTHDGSATVSDFFTYTVKDNQGVESNLATVQINITAEVIETQCSLDADGNGSVDALTDGLLIIRHMFGLRGDSLIKDAVADNCTNCEASEIEPILEQCAASGITDIDGNGEVDALTDGLLNIRYIFGIRGPALINDSLADDCTRCSAVDIEDYVQNLIP